MSIQPNKIISMREKNGVFFHCQFFIFFKLLFNEIFKKLLGEFRDEKENHKFNCFFLFGKKIDVLPQCIYYFFDFFFFMQIQFQFFGRFFILNHFQELHKIFYTQNLDFFLFFIFHFLEYKFNVFFGIKIFFFQLFFFYQVYHYF
ncbi:hypothetical protein IMG5_162730 [Ichthyophthirius multifiliis]|uniref:Transmembrane protein n=1 Tax=Ichthyophthirius multifiliis TaxID=5932 RepID=G0R091_ICHMU|nr:hypothetical protein IMG5_162730 [Ichthyophthirius multifiliis]EGR29099.1 hypothetical protein IMG5_162730 [Ichthyophthirius multifiliis]|eukprot:XP_004030335.1 hypothetical protein IMG5_162730 [Ichthyophthirius multifiliis]